MRVGHFTSPQARDRYRRAYDEAVATLPSPQVRDVPTPFGDVRVLTCAGPPGPAPVVLLPGAGAPGATWSSAVAPLTAERTVHLIDPLGGPGASRQEVPIRTITEHARWLRAALDGLDTPSFHLTGTSMGGRLAFELARRSPAGLVSLSLVEPARTVDRIPWRTVAVSVGAQPSAPGWLRRRFLGTLGGGAAVDADPIGRVIDAGMAGYASALPFPPLPTDDDLRAVRTPALVLLGGRSTILDAGRAGTRARLLPDADVEVWPEASHALPGEFPERTAAAVLALAARAER